MKVIRSGEASALNRHKESRAYYRFEDLEICLVHSTIVDVQEPPFHAHPFPEIVLCLAGSVTTEVRVQLAATILASQEVLEPGDAVYFAPNEYHRALRQSPGAKLLAIKLGPPPEEEVRPRPCPDGKHDWDEYGPHGMATGRLCKKCGAWSSS